jgi:MoxR-like ATPase
VTAYHPSDFVTAVQQPGIVFIDEANRTMGRVLQIILPLTAGDHSVTNPLTGQRVAKHPDCFIILASNVGMEYVDTYAFDPALLSRSVTVDFTYLPQPDEAKLAIAATGCSAEIAKLWTTFAARTRAMATTPGNDDIPMMSTREVLQACVLQTAGLSADETALAAFVDRQSRVGGDSSVYGRLKLVWTGLRPSQQ